jgi:hypothetical protein
MRELRCLEIGRCAASEVRKSTVPGTVRTVMKSRSLGSNVGDCGGPRVKGQCIGPCGYILVTGRPGIFALTAHGRRGTGGSEWKPRSLPRGALG